MFAKIIPLKGRQSVLTDEIHDQIVENCKYLHTTRSLAASVKLHFGTLENWLLHARAHLNSLENDELPNTDNKFVKLYLDIEHARASSELSMCAKIRDSQDWRAQSWFLSKTNSEVYGDESPIIKEIKNELVDVANDVYKLKSSMMTNSRPTRDDSILDELIDELNDVDEKGGE